MQKIKELLGICNHEFKFERTQQMFIPNRDYRSCVGARTKFSIVCQKCGKCKKHSSDITFFSKTIKYQKDPNNYSFPTQADEKDVEFKMNLKLKQLKYKYKIK